MNWTFRDRWRGVLALGDTVVCAGDLGGRRNIFGRWKPSCENLPGRKIVILGNHDFTRFRWRECPLGVDASVRNRPRQLNTVGRPIPSVVAMRLFARPSPTISKALARVTTRYGADASGSD